MNVNENKSLTSTGGGCGCGCGGGSGVTITSGCSCGGQGCNACITGAFARPNFFAGQLLTEDDLQQLGDYVVAKNRLHNRFLFGEGVACGLEVNCHPCGEGRVIVQPGYALDCCGNDLTLTCAKTLDINAMVRDLRRTALGHDCGDPCESEEAEVTMEVDPKTGEVKEGETKKKPPRHYCLYIRYCEEGTDPVAPYSTGEACGATSCQTTRIREGVKFELRCEKPEHPRNDMLASLVRTFEDIESLERIMLSAAYHKTFSALNRQAAQNIRENPMPAFDVSHTERIRSAEMRLNESVKRIRPDVEKFRSASKATASTSSPAVTEVDVRTTLDALLEASSLTARFYSQDAESRRRLLATDKGLEKRIAESKATITMAREVLTPDIIERSLAHPMEKEFATGLIQVSGALTERVPPEGDASIRMLADYGLGETGFQRAAASTAESLRQWLLERLDRTPNLSDCQLRAELERLDLSAKSSVTALREQWAYSSELDAYRRTDDRLMELLVRYFRDAICAALNPKCAPCDDPAVLLACVEMSDCEVVKICNLERSYVLSPASMRYWLFPVTLVGELFEVICCTDISFTSESKQKMGSGRIGLNQMISSGRPSVQRQLASFIAEKTGIDIRRFARLGRPLSALMSRPVIGIDGGSTTVFGNFGAPRSETATPVPAPAAAESTPAAPAAPAPASASSAASAIPFDLTSGVGLAVVSRIESMIDSRVEARVAELRKEIAEKAAAPMVVQPAAPVETPPSAFDQPASVAAPAPKPAKKKVDRKPKNKPAAKDDDDAAKDEDK